MYFENVAKDLPKTFTGIKAFLLLYLNKIIVYMEYMK